MMAVRQTRRTRLLVSRGVHPHFRGAVRTYAGGSSVAVDEIPLVASGPAAGTTDLAALERLLADGEPVAGVLAGQPNFLGLLEPMAELSRLTHAAGAKFIAVIEPVSLAVLAPPGDYGADIAAGEGQPLGIAPQYGGPYLGILSCTNELVRQIPGRLVGMTTDLEGKRAFVMTLRAREQDIRRERAASSITTNQTLLALAASIWMAVMGPRGMADVVALGAARAAELEAALAAAGAPRVHAGAYLNEVAVRVPGAPEVHRRLLDRGVLAGLVLADAEPDDPTLADALLVCATEVTTPDEIQRFAGALRAELGSAAGAPREAVTAR
jgi:glycine dehydrogenase subunit 1